MAKRSPHQQYKKYDRRDVQLEVPDSVLADIRDVIASIPWTRAKSYEETFPHEYGQKRKVADELLPKYQTLAVAIPTYGYTVTTKNVGTWTYLDIDGYKYWTGWQNHDMPDWINRVKETESKV